jgi:hypothetical protein
MEKVKMDYNSIENQEIKGKFVEREVLTCFSYEMEAVLRASQEGKSKDDYPLPNYEEIENLFEYVCPECGEGFKTEEEAKDCCQSEQELEYNPQEVFEWWIVTEFLYKHLQKRGYVVLEWGNNCYWGRCTTGQAILLDRVISDICEEMEILDGQKYSWARK